MIDKNIELAVLDDPINSILHEDTGTSFTSSYDEYVSFWSYGVERIIVEGSVSVLSMDMNTTYTEGVDYELDIGRGYQDIKVLSSGSMSDNTEYNVVFDYEERNNVFTIGINNDVLTLGLDSSDVQIYDITDATNPILASTVSSLSSDIYGFSFGDNNTLAISSYNSYVLLMDISDPYNPVELSQMTDPTDQCRDVSIYENILVVGCHDTNIYIYDISDPSSPVLLNTISEPGSQVVSVHVDDNLLVSGEGNNTVRLYDISDPSNPVLLSKLDGQANMYKKTVFIKNDLLITGSADYSSAFSIYDISDPENPVFLSETGHGSSIMRSFSVTDNLLFAIRQTGDDTGGNIYDISDPSNPILTGLFEPYAYSVASQDNKLVTGMPWERAHIFDISGYQNDFVDIPFAKLPSFTFQGNEYKTDNALSEISVYLNDTHLQSYTTDLFSRKEISIDPATLNDGDNFFLVIAEDINGKQSRATAVIGKEYFSNTTLEHDTEEYKLIMPQACMHAEATWEQHAVGYVTDSVRFLFDRKPNNMLPVSEASTATDNTVTVKRVQNVETEVIG